MNPIRRYILKKVKEPGSKKMFVGFLCGLAIGKWVPELEERLDAFTSEYAIEQLFAIEHLYELFFVTFQATMISLMIGFFLLYLFDKEKWYWLLMLIPAFLGINFLLLIIFGDYPGGGFEFVFIGVFSLGAIVLFVSTFRQWLRERSTI